jgi:hypothetical protein
MIYEVRTYRLNPGSLAEVVKLFGEGYEHRKAFSELAAFWYTEIGPLNEIVHVWPYADLAERDRIRTEATKSPHWPPPIRDHITDMRSEIFTPSPYTPELLTGANGPIYEMRSYTLRPGAIPATIEAWGTKIEARRKLSPVVISMYSEFGALNRHVHVWAYKSLDERAAVREKARAEGIWPPKGGGGRLVAQENKILLPPPFSPAH